MNRYRSYNQEDDPPLEEGDKFFVGVNQFDIAENLAPGQVQAATNMDFTDATAKTRGGFICLPELGTTRFGSWVFGNQPSPGGSMRGEAFGNGLFVAVGGSGRIITSINGLMWTLRSCPDSLGYRAIAFGNGLFVAVAASTVLNGIITSPDGITWTQRTSAANATWDAIGYGNSLFVAVAVEGNVMTSPDGITWTSRTPSASVAWTGVTYGAGLFVAVADDTVTHVMTSPDGITWTSRAGQAGHWNAVAYGTPAGVSTFVATGTLGKAMYSYDGITWTLATTPASLWWYAVAYGGGMFMAIAFGATSSDSMRSFDGITWDLRTTPSPANSHWSGIAYGNGLFSATAQGFTNPFYDAMVFYYPQAIFASGRYSDPSAPTSEWIVIISSTQAGFFSFGQTSRTIPYPSGVYISQQSTVVQSNNYLFIFPGAGQTPLRWDGTWGGAFITAPASTLGAGFQNIPQSNQATYYQNRLWVVNGKDTESASQNLDFQNFNVLAAAFNLNVGTSDYLIASYPFGDNSLLVFKKNSVYLLQNVDGALTDVTSTEITRQLGITGINACVSVGPDVVFMTDRNITTVRLSIQNKLQGVTIPLSQNINPIIRRVNWAYANKISMGYSNNLLFVALPLDNATVCSTIIVYNFITQQWYGEWNFSAAINMAVQGFVRANYLGQIRLHVVTEDGRIFVTDQGQNDISGTTVAEISTSLTTRAYRLDNNSHVPRRMYMDVGTNRPNFTVTAYAEGASESSTILSGQTYSRANSWLFNDSTYTLTNANDDYNRAFRQDYSTGPNSIQCGTGFQPEMTQDYRFPIITRRKGRLSWFQVSNVTGFIRINGVGVEARPGDRSNFVQVG